MRRDHDSRAAGCLTRHSRGTPQMYLLFTVTGRFEDSRRARRPHGGAPELSRWASRRSELTFEGNQYER